MTVVYLDRLGGGYQRNKKWALRFICIYLTLGEVQLRAAIEFTFRVSACIMYSFALKTSEF